MATVGERLQEAREQAGLTLHDVAEQTKVPRWILASIEADDLSRVPGGVFIRGYLTSFARAVGLDGDRLWADHRAEAATPAVEPELPAREDPPREGASRLATIGVAVAVLVTAVVWRNMARTNPDSVNFPAAASQERANDVLPAVAPTSGPATEAVAAVDSTEVDRVALTRPPLNLHVRATSDVWLEAKADGQQRVYRLLTTGEELTVDARNEIALRVGDAAAVSYTIDGARGRALGTAGAVRDLVITPDNYLTFVDASP